MPFQLRERAPARPSRRSARRSPIVALAVLLTFGSLVPVGPAWAAATVLDLAAEAPVEGEPLPGPEPELDHEANEFAPEPYQPPWTFGLGVILAVVSVLAILGIALGWMRVRRNEERSGGSARR